MSARGVFLRSDEETITERVVEMTMDTVGQLAGPERQHCDAVIRALVTGSRDFNTLEAAINARIADEVDKATRLGFCLALSLASHAVRGDRPWLAEALRLAGEDATVEVRQEA